jgi:hypothetical protein
MPDRRFIAAIRQLLDLLMDPAQAFAAICLAAVGCDGQLGRDEAHALRAQKIDTHFYLLMATKSVEQKIKL